MKFNSKTLIAASKTGLSWLWEAASKNKEPLSWFVVGFLVSVPVVIAVFLLGEKTLSSIVWAFIILSAGASITFGLAFVLLKSIATRFFGDANKSTEKPIKASKNLLSDAKVALTAIVPKASDEQKEKILSLGAGVLPMIGSYLARQHLVALLLGAVLAFTGGANIFLLLQQNRLLESQERIIEAQTIATRDMLIAQDATRYSALYASMMEVLSAIAIEGKQREGLENYQLVTLSDDLTNQIVSLSQAFRPYWYFDSYAEFDRSSDVMDAETIAPKMVFLSPERGMLLRAIVDNYVHLDFGTADFSYADMRGVHVLGAYDGSFSGASDGDLLGFCEHARSQGTLVPVGQEPHLKGDEFPEDVILYKYDLRGYNIENADFSHSSLNGVVLSDHEGTLDFFGARLLNVLFETKWSLDLSEADIYRVAFYRNWGSDSPEVSFSGARVWNEPCVEGGQGFTDLLEAEIYRLNGGGVQGTIFSEIGGVFPKNLELGRDKIYGHDDRNIEFCFLQSAADESLGHRSEAANALRLVYEVCADNGYD